MKTRENKFLKAIRSGEKQIGLWISLCSGFAAEIVAGAEFDWVVVDMEHSPNELSIVLHQLQAIEPYHTTAIVRPDWNDTVKVKRLLDMGAQGLLFPMVQNVEEAQAAVAATRYPPRGVRGVSGMQRGNKFGRAGDYFDRVEEETCVIVQVETMTAIEQVVEIGTVDGVDGVFFGPADIAADMGHLGKPMEQAVWDVILPAAKKLMSAGVPVGTLVFDPVRAAELLKEGFTFVACGSDHSLVAKGSDNLLATVKGNLG